MEHSDAAAVSVGRGFPPSAKVRVRIRFVR
jgi:hypothetical protein